MNIFFQKEDGEFRHEFIHSTYLYSLFNKKDNIIIVDLSCDSFYNYIDIHTRYDIAIGSVEFVNMFFDTFRIKRPELIDYPTSIKFALKRNIDKITYKYFIKQNKINRFIKPSNEQKLFEGTYIESYSELNILKDFYNIPEDTELYVSDYINFLTEYRIFVNCKHIHGIHYYKGDVLNTFSESNIKDIKFIIDQYEDAPAAYSLDIGIFINNLGKKDIALVEVNDFFALGSYGLQGYKYLRLTKERFKEIINGKLN